MEEEVRISREYVREWLVDAYMDAEESYGKKEVTFAAHVNEGIILVFQGMESIVSLLAEEVRDNIVVDSKTVESMWVVEMVN